MEQIYVHFLEEVGVGLSIYNLRSFQYETNATSMTKQLCERLLQLNPNRSLAKEDPKTYENRPSLNNFETKNNSVPGNNFIESHGILQVLLSQFIDEKNIGPNSVKYKGGKITETLYYISANLQQELTVQHLAQRCHINPDHFSRLFKEQTGILPLRYVQNKRIERAQILISTTNRSLQEIADLVGLPNISYFSRVFSKLTSKSPATYRKEHWSV
jgi:AraC-like DNA-binding protein